MIDDNPTIIQPKDNDAKTKMDGPSEWLRESSNKEETNQQYANNLESENKTDEITSIYDMPTRPIVIRLENEKSQQITKQEVSGDQTQSDSPNEDHTLPVWLMDIIADEIPTDKDNLNDNDVSNTLESAEKDVQKAILDDSPTISEALSHDTDHTETVINHHSFNGWIPEEQTGLETELEETEND